jgi:hypothetical protein
MANCQGCGFQHYDGGTEHVGLGPSGTGQVAGTDLCRFCAEICRKAKWSPYVLERLGAYLLALTPSPNGSPVNGQERQSQVPGSSVSDGNQYTE